METDIKIFAGNVEQGALDDINALAAIPPQCGQAASVRARLPQGIFEHRIRKEMPFGFDINESPDCDLKELHHLISRNVTRFASEHPEMADFAIEIRCDGDMIEWFRRFGMTEKMFFNSLPSMGGGNHFVEYDENAGLESTPMHPRYSPLSSPIFALRGKAEM